MKKPKKNTGTRQKNATNRSKKPRKARKSGRKARVVKLRWWSVSLIALVLWCLFCLPFVRDKMARSRQTTGAEVPAKVHGEFGIDISHNNRGRIQWDSLMVMTTRSGKTTHDKKTATDIKPVSFVFIKATEGQSMVDRKFSLYWENAAGAGINRGAYHFYRTSKDPVKQAENYIRTVGVLRHQDLPPVLDIETVHSGMDKVQLNENLLVWLRKVEEHYGRKPIVYTYDSFASDYLSKEITDNYPIWIARYNTETPGLDNWTYWQFTDRALVYGMEYPVDMSVLRK